MLDKILVLLDGSALAQRVLPHARAFANTFAARITLLRVLETKAYQDGRTQVDPVNWHLRKVEAQSYLNNLRQNWEGTEPPRVVLDEGTAVDRIIHYAQTEEPNLVMLTTHGQSGLSPSAISSVAYKIIHLLPTSFMLVRANQLQKSDEKVQYQRIMVPLDGSRRAECVLPFASRLAVKHKAQLFLVHVPTQGEMIQGRPLSPPEDRKLKELYERNKSEADLYLREFVVQEDVSVSTHLLTHPQTTDALLDFTHTEQIDLVMMCAHGQSGAQNRLYGSLIPNFIHYSPAALFVLQDLSAEQIKTFKTQSTASDTGDLNRKIAYAQPKDWKPS